MVNIDDRRLFKCCILSTDARWNSTFTTTNTTQNKKTSGDNNAVNSATLSANQTIGKVLYKQLLSWCRHVGHDVPFDRIPPITFVPPRIDKNALLTFSKTYKDEIENNNDLVSNDENGNKSREWRMKQLAKCLPHNSIVDHRKLIVPVENASHVKAITQLIFLLNQPTSQSNDDGYLDSDIVSSSLSELDLKNRTALGFECLKSLNQLTQSLEKRKESRTKRDRIGVHFEVGDVVQHKIERWRAVITGWKRKHLEPTSTSLTDKKYSFGEENTDATNITTDKTTDENRVVEYSVILDEGDVMLSRMRVFGEKHVKQGEIEAINDDALKRVRSRLLSTNFKSFNPSTMKFTPNTVLQYEYAMDDDSNSNTDDVEDKPILSQSSAEDIKTVHEISKTILKEVKQSSEKLKRIILDTTSCAEARNLKFIHNFEKKLGAMIDGDLSSTGEVLSSTIPLSSSKIAIMNLSNFLEFSLEVIEMMKQRKKAIQNTIKYPPGSIVIHKKYGFRGVVIEWDQYPRTDVSRWDGLQDIEGDLNSMPFYHILADRNDTASAFGAERPFRYVCSENLEECRDYSRSLDTSIDDMEGWEMDTGSSIERYIPPDDVKFKHGDDLGDDEEVVDSCMKALLNEICNMLLSIKDGSQGISIDHLLFLLQHASSLDDAFVIEETIKEIWKSNFNMDLRWELDNGSDALMRGDKRRALEIFDDIVATDPEYFEAWNKKATCHYLLGATEESLKAAETAINLNNSHFQAYSGSGLVYSETGRYEAAAKCFRQSLRIDPWSPISSRLSLILDMEEEKAKQPKDE